MTACAGFKGPIVPGMLCASLFPTIIARHFPGAVYLTQNLQFRRPAPVISSSKYMLHSSIVPSGINSTLHVSSSLGNRVDHT